MPARKRYLVTTADERTWKLDRPVLFLGEWCRIYDRRHVWMPMDAIVARPYGTSAGQKRQDIDYAFDQYEQLIVELTEALNRFHGTSHGVRYWSILIGHWVQRFVMLLFNRYATLQQALLHYEVSGTSAGDPGKYSLATYDSLDFIWASGDDVWNQVLYAKILGFIGGVPKDESGAKFSGFFHQPQRGRAAGVRQRARRALRTAGARVLAKLSREDDAFIIGSSLPGRQELKLSLALGQWPQQWQSPQAARVAPDRDARLRLALSCNDRSGFGSLVRQLMHEVIPSCYVEGYGNLLEQTRSLPWPKQPRFLLTSYNFDTDEVFKAWAADKIEEGTPYFVGQHGNNWGTLNGTANNPEMLTCDRFLTWGWSDVNPVTTPSFVLRLAGRREQSRPRKTGGLLLVEVHCPHRLATLDTYAEFAIYQEEQFRFFGALPEPIQREVTVRLHGSHGSFRWAEEQRWHDRYPQARREAGAASMTELLADSRLAVYSYDSTGVLEALALNTPVICFWHGGLEHLVDEAKPYYELLRAAGIVADTPEQAAAYVARCWHDVAAWWLSDSVQDARRRFCNRYARLEPHPITTLKRLLEQESVAIRKRGTRE